MASDDDELESFEITDYDLQSELNPGLRKRQTKEQAVYGIWATSDDEYEFDGTHQRGSKIRKSDYAEPMGFVSAGVFQKRNDDVDPLEIQPEQKNETPEPEKETRGQTFRDVQARYQKNAKKFGAWEKYTTGFGSKMLEKMGYTGKGLGKEGEGIIEPVQAFKRKGKAAIGAYGSEKPDEGPIVDEEEVEEIEIKKEIEKLHQWKKTGQDVAKPKYVYKTADEVKKSGTAKKLAPLLNYGNVKVVDMTGPETKVLHGYSSLGNQHTKPEDGKEGDAIDTDEKEFELPELVYNLNLLVDLAESEIIQIDRQLRFENDNVINMGHELERLTTVCNEEEIEIENLENVLKIVERCKCGMDPYEDKELTLDSLIKCFQVIRQSYYEEYKMYDLEKLVVPLGFPLLVRHFAVWKPLADPAYGIEVIKLWKEVLDENTSNNEFHNQNNEQRQMESFERLIWEVWMPHIRSAVGQWKAKNCDPLIAVLEAWVYLIPEWITANILDQLVTPKLQNAVEVWNPLIDPTPIHSWLHPWLPLMGQRLEPLYGPIRHKFASALTTWHPSDPSAKVILDPWVKVFSRGAMEAFLLRSIFPKLEICMKDFTINPHQQLLEPFHWIMTWKDIISEHHMVSILDKHLFPKWLQVLRKWLTSDPNYDEVTKWYLGWKSMFADNFITNPTIKEHFNRALMMMNQSVSGTLQPGAKENVAYLTNTERRREAEQATLKAEKKASSATSYSGVVPTRFKDLVEQAAEEHGLLFIPMPNRRYEGKTVYSFGKCVICIDKDVIFISSEGKWKPSSLQDVIDLAR